MASLPPRQLHLNVNILHSGFVPSAWRTPDADPRAFIVTASSSINTQVCLPTSTSGRGHSRAVP